MCGWSLTPIAQLTGLARCVGLAVRRRIDQGVARPGPCAVAGPVEHRVMRSASQGPDRGAPPVPMDESQLADSNSVPDAAAPPSASEQRNRLFNRGAREQRLSDMGCGHDAQRAAPRRGRSAPPLVSQLQSALHLSEGLGPTGDTRQPQCYFFP